MKLSIVIPAFNCEKTIGKCLNSIYEQNTDLKYEVIVVNDGSVDKTVNVVNEYIKTNNNIIILSQNNKGAGAARNKGIEASNGDYLLFIDADDYLLPNALNVIKTELNKKDIDVLIYTYRYFDEKENKFKDMPKRDSDIYCNQKILGRVFSFSEYEKIHECIAYPWNKVFSREFVNKNELRFSETIVHNDIFFNIASEFLANKIKIVNDVLYVHVINKVDGQLTQRFDEIRLNAMVVLDRCDSFFRERKVANGNNISYLVFKAILIDWAISKAKGAIRDAFVNYMNVFLRSLDSRVIMALLDSKVVTEGVKRSIKLLSLPVCGGLYDSSEKIVLSIIVPVFNVEPYLPQCLQSIANQTLDSRNYEVILIDDKSTDNSAAICEQFCEKYDNFKLIKLDKNTPGGAGIPSNIGIDRAIGEYVGFVDSDDYIKPDMFAKLLLCARGADITLCNFDIYYQKENKKAKANDTKAWQDLCKLYKTDYSIRELQSKLLAVSPVPWRKLYRRQFLVDNKIKYPEGDFFFEDNPLHWFVVTKAKSVHIYDEPLITHRIGRVGQTMEGKPEKLIAFAQHASIIKNYLRENNELDEFKIEYISWLFSQSSWVVPKLGKLKGEYIKRISTINKDIKFEDLKSYRKMRPHKYGTMIYNACMIKGYYYIGVILRTLINKYLELKKNH